MAENGAMPDEGATPIRLASEANSTANHVRDDFREYRREQAKINAGLRQLVMSVDRRVGVVASDVSTTRGELRGEARATRRLMALAGLGVAIVAAATPIVLHLMGASR